MPRLGWVRYGLVLLTHVAQISVRAQTSDVSQAGMNAFNPAITVFGNAVWRIDDRSVVEEEDGERIVLDDRFLLREVEVDLRAAVDPYADGVLILAVEQEQPGEFGTAVEEGYVLVKSLPVSFWEEPPLGTKITLGRFRANLGNQNLLHTHDLPQPRRGLLYESFIGEEGYVGQGISLEGFLPSPWETALTLDLEALQGGEFLLVEGDEDNERPNYVAHLDWFTLPWDEHSLELGLTANHGANDGEGHRRANLGGLDFTYRWKPFRAGQWRSILVGGQGFYAAREVGDPGDEETERAAGYFAHAQYQIDRRWYAGLRYDRVESLEDRDEETSRITPFVSCYLSEFFRIRLAYEHTSSDLGEIDGLDTFLFEINFVLGAHPPHPYWANF